MPIWFLFLGGFLAYLAGRSSAPAVTVGSARLPAPLPPPPSVRRPGEQVRFELGVPYAIVATSAAPAAKIPRLEKLLALGTWHARNIAIRPEAGGCQISLCFLAPKTATVPVGTPLDWDLGDGRVRLTLREVRRLDGKAC